MIGAGAAHCHRSSDGKWNNHEKERVNLEACYYYGGTYFTGVHINQDLMWCEKIVLYMGFCVHRGS